MHAKRPDKIEGQIKAQLVDNPDEQENDDIGLETLQPRKIDWDLKRDLKSKMAKLDRRTHNSLTQMLRDRLAKDKKSDQPEENITDTTTTTEHPADETNQD